MLKIVISLLVFTSAQAIFLETCRNYAPNGGVSMSYESCINRNFRQIDYELNTNLYRCRNYSRYADQNFTYCIDSNFQEVRRRADRIFLMRCFNHTRNLSYNFIDCANRNFDEIERYIRFRD